MTIRSSSFEQGPDRKSLEPVYGYLTGLAMGRQAEIDLDRGDVSGGYRSKSLESSDIGRLLTREYKPPDGPPDPDTGEFAILTPPNTPPRNEGAEVVPSQPVERQLGSYVLSKA